MMRLTMALLCGAIAVLGACGPKDGEGNSAAEAGLTAEAISANDITAIDAVTGQAANMAADMDYDAIPAGNTSVQPKPRPAGQPASSERPGRPAETTQPADAAPPAAEEPAVNSE